MLILMQNLARYGYAMHPTASVNLVYVANGVANTVVV